MRVINYEGEYIKIWNESNHTKIALDLKNCSYIAVTNDVIYNQ